MRESRTLKIERKKDNGIQTLGEGVVLETNEWSIYSFKTLELPWKNNEKQISCIPKGNYNVVKRISPKFGLSFHITNVPNRSLILIHSGNYYTQIQGCILVGTGHTDINKDGQLDVINSKSTMKDLLELLPNEFTLEIV